LFLLFVVCLIPFIGYFANPLLAGFDSYAFASEVCGHGVEDSLGSELFKSLLFVFPCNFFLIKVVLFIVYFIAIVALALWGEEVLGKERGWLVGFVSATISPLLFFEALKFENDIFGWSLSFVALCLLFKGFSLVKWHEKRVKGVMCIILGLGACFLAFLCYLPSLLVLLGVGLVSVYTIFLAFLAGVVLLQNVPMFREPINGIQALVSEEMIASGIPWIAFFLPFIWDIPKKYKLPTIVLLGTGFVKAKVMLFAVPWLALGLVEADAKFKDKRWWPNLVVVGLVFCVAFSFMAYFTVPTTQNFADIKEVIQLSQDNNYPLYNDWSYGWWVWYNGYETNYKAFYPDPDYNNLPKPYLAYTDTNLPCTQLKEKVFICK